MEKIKDTKAELLIRINNLENDISDKNEELFDAGIKERPTMMREIIKHEQQTINTLIFCIKECEKVTGRPFDLSIL